MRKRNAWNWSLLLIFPFLSACAVSSFPIGTTQDVSPSPSPTQPPPATASTPTEQTTQPTTEPSTSSAQPPGVTSADPSAKNYGLGVPYPDAVRGIYVTAYSASGARLQTLLNVVDHTALNTMVIDIKDDSGHITFPVDDIALRPYSNSIIQDPKALMATLKQHHIYPIARIVVFKDSAYAKAHPEASFLKQGKLWHNGNGDAFVNPFLPSVWQYNVEIAQQAARLGFAEIQFDYVRFPEGFETMDRSLQYSLGPYQNKLPSKFQKMQDAYNLKNTAYTKELSKVRAQQQALQTQADNLAQQQPLHLSQLQAVRAAFASNGTAIQTLVQSAPKPPSFSAEQRLVQLRVDAVTDFVAYARQQLKPYEVKVGVDIFGYSATVPEAPGIGQNYARISQNVDVISPMIYPSHWGPGYFNIPKPDLAPYQLVSEFEKAEKSSLAALQMPPIQRPWIQDFTASWLGVGTYQAYGKDQVDAQIRALHDSGINEFLLWNAGNSYTPGVNYKS